MGRCSYDASTQRPFTPSTTTIFNFRIKTLCWNNIKYRNTAEVLDVDGKLNFEKNIISIPLPFLFSAYTVGIPNT
jgi:hypothetical protein